MQLCSERRGTLLEHKTLEVDDRSVLRYSIPLSETVVDFYGHLKSLTSGYATFDYEAAGYEASDLIRLNLMLNGDPVDALASELSACNKSLARAYSCCFADPSDRT
jgi:translation factor GUF1, mitochondrial